MYHDHTMINLDLRAHNLHKSYQVVYIVVFDVWVVFQPSSWGGSFPTCRLNNTWSQSFSIPERAFTAFVDRFPRASLLVDSERTFPAHSVLYV